MPYLHRSTGRNGPLSSMKSSPARKHRRQELRERTPGSPSHLDRERQHRDLESGLLEPGGRLHVLDVIGCETSNVAKHIRACLAKPSAEDRDDRERGRPRAIGCAYEIGVLERLAGDPD